VKAANMMDGPEMLLVKKVQDEGLLQQWNANHPDGEFQPMDRIIEVNGTPWLEEMQKQLQRTCVKMKIVRYPDRFKVRIEKAGRKLGFSHSSHKPKNQELRITEVAASGLMAEYNIEKANAGRWGGIVMPDMIIEQVNDVKGEASKLATELRTCQAADMVIRRPELAEHLK